MVNKEVLVEEIQKSGLKKEFICSRLGMSLNTLNNKISGRTKFLVTEAFDLKTLLKMDDVLFRSIFLPNMSTMSAQGESHEEEKSADVGN